MHNHTGNWQYSEGNRHPGDTLEQQLAVGVISYATSLWFGWLLIMSGKLQDRLTYQAQGIHMAEIGRLKLLN